MLKLGENEHLDYGYTNQYRLSGLEVCLEYTYFFSNCELKYAYKCCVYKKTYNSKYIVKQKKQ